MAEHETVDLEEHVDDARHPGFRWLEQGSGEPVLFLHGLIGQMHHWDPVIDALAVRCRPMALTLPIFDEALREVSIEGLSKHVLRFLDALDIHRTVIGGNSLGGHVALALTLAHPDRVSGLILTGSSGLLERGRRRGLRDRSPLSDAWIASMRVAMTTAATGARLLRFARDAMRFNVGDRLHTIDVPTLLVWGREDRITPTVMAERFRALIRDAQLTYLDRCGHTAMLERPAEFVEVVAHWLEAIRERREGAPLSAR